MIKVGSSYPPIESVMVTFQAKFTMKMFFVMRNSVHTQLHNQNTGKDIAYLLIIIIIVTETGPMVTA